MNTSEIRLARMADASALAKLIEHLDSLFSDAIDWNLIATHLPDMIRVALSIKAGK